jgi:hypothetical protein
MDCKYLFVFTQSAHGTAMAYNPESYWSRVGEEIEKRAGRQRHRRRRQSLLRLQAIKVSAPVSASNKFSKHMEIRALRPYGQAGDSGPAAEGK